MSIDPDPVREAVEGDTESLVAIGGPYDGENTTVEVVGSRRVRMKHEPRKRDVFYVPNSQFPVQKSHVPIVVEPMRDRFHYYTRARLNGRDVLRHSGIQAAMVTP